MTTVPPGIGQQFTYTFTSLLNFAQRRGTLPLSNLTFAKTLNATGPWQASLPVEDSGIRESAWQEVTAVNRTALWVDVNGALLYGGPVTGRKYQMSTGLLTLSGSDFCFYLSQRIQAGDYKEYEDPEHHSWAVIPGASALRMAYYILTQALEKAYSVPIKVVAQGSIPGTEYWITFSAPEAQQQTLASVLSQLQELGYLVGIDYACDVAYVDGVPTATITLSYPRRGSGTPPVVDLSNALDLEYAEDGTQQADRIVEQAGATVERSSSGIWTPARDAGYPLLEAQISHTALAPAEDSRRVLEAYLAGSLTVRAYPLTAPVVTLPMFGTPSILELDVGMDVILRIPKAAGAQPLENPRFPGGLEALFRIVRIDCEVPDQGVPTIALTLNIPPALVPVEPPELDREAKEAKEKEALEAREKAKKEKEEKEATEKKEKEEKEKEEAEKAKEEAEKAAEEAVTEAEKAKEGATSERAKKEAEKVLKKAKLIFERAKKSKSKRESEKIKGEAEENKAESEIVKAPGGGGSETKITAWTITVEWPGGISGGVRDFFAGPIKVGAKGTMGGEITEIRNTNKEKVSEVETVGTDVLSCGQVKPNVAEQTAVIDGSLSSFTIETLTSFIVNSNIDIHAVAVE